MIDVSVDIFGIVMHCNESILGLKIGSDYSFEKIYLDMLPHKDRITNSRGDLNVEYADSCLVDENGKFFICLKKHNVFQISGPNITPGVVYSIDGPMACEQLTPYQEHEMAYLYEVFSLLHLFQDGNIGFYEVFFDFTYKTLGIMNNTVHYSNQSRSRNIVDGRKYILSEQAIIECSKFLTDSIGTPFSILKPSIDEFIWGIEQLDIATGFEQYTTALEMTLLEKDAQNKKKMLANRVAILTGTTSADIIRIYSNMLNYYRFRSESLHEGHGGNISTAELHSLEEYTRNVLKKCLCRCKNSITTNTTVTWNEIKSKLINDLKNAVTAAKTAGILPA